LNPDINVLSNKLGIAMLIVFILLILFIFILKRVRGGNLSFRKYPAMKIISTLSLAPKRSITLVEVCNEWLLLGVGAENISLLSKYDKPEETEENLRSQSKGEGGFASFLLRAGTPKKTNEESSIKNEQQ
jgi:flagellar biosynthetic protein FliO